MLQRLYSAVERRLLRQSYGYVRKACRDLDLARDRVAAEESAVWLNLNAPMAASYRDRFELLRRSLEAAEVCGLKCEFGVYRGDTINYLSSLRPNDTFHGFDSFEGLPENWRAGFGKDAFRQEQLPNIRPNVCLHRGLFCDSLPCFLKAHKENASLLHIDCDLYSSAKVVFDLLGDRIVPGTVIQFDEFLNYPGWRFGERKAFSEFCKARDVKVEYLGYVVRDEQLALRITAIGPKPIESRVLEAVPVLIEVGGE